MYGNAQSGLVGTTGPLDHGGMECKRGQEARSPELSLQFSLQPVPPSCNFGRVTLLLKVQSPNPLDGGAGDPEVPLGESLAVSLRSFGHVRCDFVGISHSPGRGSCIPYLSCPRLRSTPGRGPCHVLSVLWGVDVS